MIKKIFLLSLKITLLFSTSLLCGAPALSKPDVIKIGVTVGPHLEVLEYVKRNAQKENIEVKIVEFNDYILPNAALEAGEIDMNNYQHEPFLNEQIKTRNYKFTAIGKSLLFPMGLYSKKIKTIAQLKEKAKIAIPNDPTNGGRALLLLEDQGLIKLKKSASRDCLPTVLDIDQNVKKLKITEIEAPQIPRILQDVDAAVINTDWALLAGLRPSIDAIALESKDSPYANIFVVQTRDKDNPLYHKFIKIYQSEVTDQFIRKKFGDAVLRAW